MLRCVLVLSGVLSAAPLAMALPINLTLQTDMDPDPHVRIGESIEVQVHGSEIEQLSALQLQLDLGLALGATVESAPDDIAAGAFFDSEDVTVLPSIPIPPPTAAAVIIYMNDLFAELPREGEPGAGELATFVVTIPNDPSLIGEVAVICLDEDAVYFTDGNDDEGAPNREFLDFEVAPGAGQVEVTIVPEPSGLLFLVGFASVGYVRRRLSAKTRSA